MHTEPWSISCVFSCREVCQCPFLYVAGHKAIDQLLYCVVHPLVLQKLFQREKKPKANALCSL